MSISDIALLAAGIGAAYYFLRPQEKKTTTQEILDIVSVSEDGIIELSNFNFRLVIEVTPVNMALRSFEEQSAIWAGFRNMLNSLSLPCTFLIQTRHLNVRDYVEKIKNISRNLPGSFHEYAEDLSLWLTSRAEEKTIRDRRHYLILKTNMNMLNEEGIRIESEIFDTVLKALSDVKKTKIPPSEIRSLARDQLNEAKSYILGSLSGMGIAARALNRKDVLDMLYQTFNRDSGPFMTQDFEEPVLFPSSKTPEKVLEFLS
ncbi:MAG TPA: hypothetical protein DEA47_01080 [Peptococcaceae bacterium]|nr:MAG: hypothetical protein XD50_0272 [Clostridia bacterium 41_269]HBT19957.1 hypothetical protein [Peptococcaceae bacterium]